MKTYLLVLACWSCLVSSPVHGSDVSYFGVIKSQNYRQEVDSAPVILTNGYAFNAFVYASSNNLVTNATVRLPGSGGVKSLLMETGGMVLRHEERFASASALDNAYPNGNIFSSSYTMTMDTVNDGTQTATLSFLPLVLMGYPPTPQLTSLAAAQNIDTPRASCR
jgi:hypothetical protein